MPEQCSIAAAKLLPHSVVYLHDWIRFPNLHPTKENKPRELTRYLLRTKLNKNYFRAPKSGLFQFRIECGSESRPITPQSILQDQCYVRLNGTTETIAYLKEGQTISIDLVFYHTSSDSSSDAVVSLKVDELPTLHGSGKQTASLLQGSHSSAAPADWFEHVHTDEEGHDVIVTVNGIRAICRHPSGTCQLDDPITTHPNLAAYPFPHIADPELSARNLRQREDFRNLQGNNVLWTAYEAQCGRECVIPKGTTVTLNANMNVDSLTIRGALVWDTTKNGLTLSSGFVCVEEDGKFTLGSDANPMTLTATIYLKNNGFAHPAIGKRVFGGYSGSNLIGPNIEIVGRVLLRTWTLLTANALPNQNTIQVEHSNMGWQVGDRIAIAPTILPVTSGAGRGYAEVFSIQAISGTTITLNGAVSQKYLGWKTKELHAEVINLSRNVRITGDDFDANLHGLHTILSSGGVMRISYVRIEKAGQRGVIGRYPLHFHLVKSCPSCLFKGNAIEDSHQRGIIVHGSHNTLVEDNVLFFIRGAGLYVCFTDGWVGHSKKMWMGSATVEKRLQN